MFPDEKIHTSIEPEMIKHEVKVSHLDLPFLADQLAQVEILVNFLIDAARTSKNFKDFKATLEKELKKVKVTRVINVDDWLADQKEGVVVMVRPKMPETINETGNWLDANPIDYWRDEEGLPVIYPYSSWSFTDYQFTDIDREKYDIIRVIDLAEEYERKK